MVRESRPLYGQLAELMGQKVAAGELAPGVCLLGEVEVASSLMASPTGVAGRHSGAVLGVQRCVFGVGAKDADTLVRPGARVRQKL